MSLTDGAELVWLDRLIGNTGTAYTYPLELALYGSASSSPLDPGDTVANGAASLVNEIQGDGTIGPGAPAGSYARTAITWGAASGTTPAQIANSVAITFATATADWAHPTTPTTLFVNGWVIFEGVASAGDRSIWHGAFDQAKNVFTNDTVSIAIGNLQLRID